MGGVSVFERMGNVYRLLVDEAARAEREAPMLLAVAERARACGGARRLARRTARVLDLACGTGIHARLLGRAGFPVLALDASAAMLAEARRFASPPSVRYAQADLLKPLLASGRFGAGPRRVAAAQPMCPVKRPAVLALLLGNTLSVFASDAELRAVLRHVSTALRPGGLLLTQTLNYARLARAGGSAVVKHGRLRGRETVVTKSLQSLDDGRHVLLTLAAAQEASAAEANSRADWASAAESTLLRALDPDAIVAAARTAGLRLAEAWGGPACEPFDAEKSTDFVGLFQSTLDTSTGRFPVAAVSK